MTKKIVIILLSFLLLLSLFPSQALAVEYFTYDDNDYNKIQAFLNQTSSDGIKTNGESINSTYDANNPSTWMGITWSDDNPRRVTQIVWNYKDIAGNLDVSNFSSLERLDCFGCDISSVNLSDTVLLDYIDFYENNLSELEIHSNPEFIGCEFNNISSLDVSDSSDLEALYCESNNMSSLDISGCINLIELDCNDNNISNLDISECINLIELDCNDNNISNLDFSGCTNLTYLYCDNNTLTGTLDVSMCNNLFDLYCGNNLLSALVLSDNMWYDYLYTSNNKIKTITTAMFGRDQTFTADGDGYISLYMDYSEHEIYLDAAPGKNSMFYNWTQGVNEISKSPRHYINPGMPDDLDITANFKPGLTSSVSGSVIYTGGRIKVTPLFAGGTWHYDDKYLKGNFTNVDNAVFTALKSGATQISYTVDPGYVYETPPIDIKSLSKSAIGWEEHAPSLKSDRGAVPKAANEVMFQKSDSTTVSVALNITIKDAPLPVTGQNFIPVVLLGSTAVVLLLTVMIIRKKNKNV